MVSPAVKEEIDEELPFEENFIEQAEYIDTAKFLALTTGHPQEESILKKLMGGGAKLMIGPRGCGKSTLMLKAFHQMLRQTPMQALPVYVNFKLALKIEPLYTKGPNAPYWFRAWLIIRVIKAIRDTFAEAQDLTLPENFPHDDLLSRLIEQLEAGNVENVKIDKYNVGYLSDLLDLCVSENGLSKCILLIDDAAHAFSEKQQEDFFDFFRAVKSRTVSPKAAVYPGITSHSPSFQVGHDAEKVNVWMKPIGSAYEEFMLELAKRRFAETHLDVIERNSEDIIFLAYAAFGVPRAFLGMLRSIYNSPSAYVNADGSLSKAKVLQLARQGKEMSHAVFTSLEAKLPSYRSYVENGASVYQSIVEAVKNYNAEKEPSAHAIQFGIKMPVEPDLEKVFGFFQYAGLLMSSGDIMRGVKGTFAIYDVHIGDLIAENAIVGRRTKSIQNFLSVLRTNKHQAWPRYSSTKLLETTKLDGKPFSLSLPQCQVCGTERASPDARFCANCGSQLKSSSTYEKLVEQDISVLRISGAMQKRIKENSQIRRVRDILIDSSREKLRSINYIGEVRAKRIVGAAEEYVS